MEEKIKEAILCALEYQTSVREKLSSEEVDLIITQATTQLKALFVEAVSEGNIATIIGKFFGLIKVNPKNDIYKDITIAKTAEEIVNWRITYGLAHAIAQVIAEKVEK